MNAQEQQMLQGLVDRINGTQLAEKDDQAEEMLQQTLGRNPDAMYILAQTVLVQQYALEQAQKQLADARNQMAQMQQNPAPQPKHATSFLGNLLHLNNDEPSRPAPPPPPVPSQPQYAPVPGYAPGYAPVPGYAPMPGYGQPVVYGAPQQGGFLRSALQTASGVAAGALAFEGIESLMHGFGHAAGYGSGFGGVGDFGGAGRPEEIVNNYYGSAGSEHGERAEHTDYLSSGVGDPDRSDRGLDSRFSDAAYREPEREGLDTSASRDDYGVDSNVDTGSGDLSDNSGDFDSGGGDDSGGGGDSFA